MLSVCSDLTSSEMMEALDIAVFCFGTRAAAMRGRAITPNFTAACVKALRYEAGADICVARTEHCLCKDQALVNIADVLFGSDFTAASQAEQRNEAGPVAKTPNPPVSTPALKQTFASSFDFAPAKSLPLSNMGAKGLNALRPRMDYEFRREILGEPRARPARRATGRHGDRTCPMRVGPGDVATASF